MTIKASIAGPGGTRYKTRERVDANNLPSMDPNLRYLVSLSDEPVYFHRDQDFTVDLESLVSSDYIYAICSVDAHGIISNYSVHLS